MKCAWCDCDIEEGEEFFTEDDGPFCEDCFDEADAESKALNFHSR